MPQVSPRRWPRIVLIVLAVLIVLYAIAGFFVAPGIVRGVLLKQASATLHRTVTVARVRVNPFALSLTVDSLRVADRDTTTLLSFDRFYINFQLVSLFKREFTFAEVRLVGPYARLAIRADGRMNISDIIDSLNAAPKEPKPPNPKPPPVLAITVLHIENAHVAFVDSSAIRPFATTVGPGFIDLRDFATRSDSHNQYSFAGRTESGEKFSLAGTFAIDPVRSTGEFSFDSIRLAKYGTFYESAVGFDVASGLGAVRAKYTVDLTPKKEIVQITEGTLRLDQLALAIRGLADTAVQLRQLEISGVSVDPLQHDARVASVALQGGKVNVARDAKGILNLSKLAAGEAPPRSAPAKPAASSKPPVPWRWSVARVSLDSFAVNVTDSAAGRPARFAITGLSLQADGVASDTAAATRLRAALTWQGTGTLSAQGAVNIWQKRGDLAITLSKMSLAPFDAYLAPRVMLLISDGAMSATAKLRVDVSDAKKPDIVFAGDVRVDKFATTDAMAKGPFLSFASLSVKGIDYSQRKSQLGIAAIALEAPDVEIALLANGSPSTSLIFPADSTPAPAKPDSSAHAAPKMHISIGGLKLTNGRVGVADSSIKPPFSVTLNKIDVTTGKLSTDSIGVGTLEMTTAVNNAAPLTVKGRINLLNQREGSELAVGMQGMDMLPLGPYFGKHVGYGIAAGKLSLAITYRVADRRLTSHTKITMNGFEWGEATNSPDATKLPVKTAFTVMRDRSGRIVLEVPVEGNLDDPSFRLEQVVYDQFKSLIIRIATSPFALLGLSKGGGDEDLTYVQFAHGAHALSDADKKKLDAMAKEMHEHPGLKIQIAGSVDSTADKKAGDLHALASARAKACLDYLVTAGKVEGERVIIAGGMKTEGARAIFLPQP